MKNALTIVGSILVCCVLYLLFWPVPVDPVAWDAPVDQGLVAPYGPNDRLRRAQGIDLGDYQGPEDVTSGIDGQLYATTSGGAVIRINSDGDVSLFADVGGRALGIETDTDGSLVVANAYLGVQRISPQGTVSTLLNEVEGKALLYADDLAIADDGVIYFSDASSKFGALQSGGTFEASLLDIMEHGGHGRVIRFDPASGEARVIIDNLNFANGVAISDDQDFLLISETGSYRILKHWLQGPAAGSNEVLLDNLPFSLAMEAPWTLAPSAAALGSLAAVAVVSTALPAFLLFWLIQRVGATNGSLLAFFMPVVAVTLGTTLLGETLSGPAFAGLGLIMLGAAAVTGRISLPVKAAA